jgi:hypothetical protein
MSIFSSRLQRISEWFERSEPLLFYFLLLAHVAFIWAFPIFITQDGPAHLDNANILLNYFGPHGALLREYYLLNTGIFTNWLGEVILACLSWLLPLFIAEKLMWSGYVILLPLSIRYAISQTGSGSRFISLFSFPLAFSWLFFMGFQPFCFSLPFFFFYAGYLMRCRNRYRYQQSLILIVLGLLLALWHIFSLMMAMWAAAIWSIWMVLFETCQRKRERTASFGMFWRLFISRVIPPLAFFIPALLIMKTFFSAHGEIKEFLSNLTLNSLFGLAVGGPLRVFSRWENVLAPLFVAVLVVTTALFLFRKLVRADLKLEDAWFVMACWSFFLYLALPPNAMHTMYITPRIALYVYSTLLLWLGAQIYSRIAAGWLKGVAVVLAVAFLGFRVGPMVRASDFLGEYLFASQYVKRGSTLLPLFATSSSVGPHDDSELGKVGYLCHASQYITAMTKGVNLDNHEALKGYFPIFYRPGLAPTNLLPTGNETVFKSRGQVLNIPSYQGGNGSRIDYVLLWGSPTEQVDDEAFRSLMQQLDQSYILVVSSPGRGLMRLYQRRDMRVLTSED